MKTVEVPIETIRKLADTVFGAWDFLPWAKDKLQDILIAAEALPKGEISRAEAFAALEKGQEVECPSKLPNDRPLRFKKVNGWLQVLDQSGNWVDPHKSMFRFRCSDYKDGWRVLKPEPPKMDFVIAAKQCFDNCHKIMISENKRYCLCAYHENLVEPGKGSSIYFNKELLTLRWIIRDDVEHNYYTATGEVWDGN